MKKLPWLNGLAVAGAVFAIAVVALHNRGADSAIRLLNVSYDPTRELYKDINREFAPWYRTKSGTTVEIAQSHGGSSSQAKQVAKGELKADVVTLGLPSDIDGLAQRGLLPKDWATRLPNRSRPYYSTIVFVVRHGNPLLIKDWPDIVRPGVDVITPDPTTSGNGKLVALAAWGSVVTRGGSEDDAKHFLKELYQHAPFLLQAARAAGVAFAVEKIGDVHLAWENEALREVGESKGQLEVVYPPVSILAEPSVTWIDGTVAANHTEALAQEYLHFLFSDAAQEIIARDGYRPFDQAVLARHRDRFGDIKLFSVTDIAQSWAEAQQTFFGENGIIQTVYAPKPRS
jgi:sulfate transport system substrate-binding protein